MDSEQTDMDEEWNLTVNHIENEEFDRKFLQTPIVKNKISLSGNDNLLTESKNLPVDKTKSSNMTDFNSVKVEREKIEVIECAATLNTNMPNVPNITENCMRQELSNVVDPFKGTQSTDKTVFSEETGLLQHVSFEIGPNISGYDQNYTTESLTSAISEDSQKTEVFENRIQISLNILEGCLMQEIDLQEDVSFAGKPDTSECHQTYSTEFITDHIQKTQQFDDTGVLINTNISADDLKPETNTLEDVSFITDPDTNKNIIEHLKPAQLIYTKESQRIKTGIRCQNVISSSAETITTHEFFECNLCGKYFRNKFHLIGHIKTHNREILFTCPVCKKTFASEKSLQSHKITHKTKKYVHNKRTRCDVCPIIFKGPDFDNSRTMLHVYKRLILMLDQID